jgi:hypothetical protein
MQKIMRIFILIGIFALAWSVSACQVEPPATPIPSQPIFEQQEVSTPTPLVNPESLTQSECPGLESTLLQLIQAPDPLNLAHQLQLNTKADKLQVMLILAHEETGFLQNFEAEVSSQLGERVQAFVPIDRLCELARADEVMAIRLPTRIFSQ